MPQLAAVLRWGPVGRACPWQPLAALPDPSSQLRGGLAGVGHPAGAVEGEAEPGSRQQQSQGGQQPPPRLSPAPCCQLHLQGRQESRGEQT